MDGWMDKWTDGWTDGWVLLHGPEVPFHHTVITEFFGLEGTFSVKFQMQPPGNFCPRDPGWKARED